tara:strand:- start:27 stop:179 length:153 start_codon:yes stop_codon:yes gene_type:complete
MKTGRWSKADAEKLYDMVIKNDMGYVEASLELNRSVDACIRMINRMERLE